MSLLRNQFQGEQLVAVTFDVANHADFGATDAGELKTGTYGLGFYVPDNAIITHAWYDVLTTFTTAGADAGTLALQANAADDLVAALAVSDASNIWDAGLHSTKIPFGAQSTYLQTDLTSATPSSDDFALAASDGTGGPSSNDEADTLFKVVGAVQNNYRLLSEGEAPNFIKMTESRELKAVLGTQDFTAGKLNLFVRYVVSG